MLNNIQNIIHVSCLPLNSNFSHIKDTAANRKIYPYRMLSSTSFSTFNHCDWCQISSEIGTWQG